MLLRSLRFRSSLLVAVAAGALLCGPAAAQMQKPGTAPATGPDVPADAAEARELKKRIRLLEQENEVLRRAAAYLSQANLRLGGSPK